MIFFNDNDPSACTWLRQLITDGHLTGDVLEKSITEIEPEEVQGYERCHFFAGIAGWELALRLAEWPSERPVWTGSCPCQPFSAAGKGEGETDKRHLWPAWFSLIRDCRPDCLFGEQVASRDGYRWLDGVRTDLESEGYTFGAADLPAACVGAPFNGGRLFWVASSDSSKCSIGIQSKDMERPVRQEERRQEASNGPENNRAYGVWGCSVREWEDGIRRRVEPGTFPLAHGFPGQVGLLRGYGNAIVPQVGAAFIKAFLEAERSLE